MTVTDSRPWPRTRVRIGTIATRGTERRAMAKGMTV
jgi:hypothetical protein